MESVVIVVVAFNGGNELLTCMESLAGVEHPEMELRIVVVDNCSSDGIPELLSQKYPFVHILKMPTNLGYGCGVNAAWRFLQEAEWQVTHLCVLNQDIVVEPSWLGPLVSAMEVFPDTAVVQPQILLEHDRTRVNARGLRCHYLGFSFVHGLGEVKDCHLAAIEEIGAASGAAMMIRCNCLRAGEDIFAPDLFMYQEDVELSWILRTRGYKCRAVPGSIVYHKYEPTGFFKNYFLLERNRWKLILTHFPTSHIVLTLPALLLMEVAQMVWASFHGLFWERFRVYLYFCSYRHVINTFNRRTDARQRGEILSNSMIASFTGSFESQVLTAGTAHRLLNDIFSLYWRFLKTLTRKRLEPSITTSRLTSAEKL